MIFQSKQLTFEVSEDGEVAKRIVTLIVENRCNGQEIVSDDEFSDESDKYKGVYYLVGKLLCETKQDINAFSLPEHAILQLVNSYTLSPSSLLTHKQEFLQLFTLLYLLHTQLNQLQYIQNISHTIFSYLKKQHALLIQKINHIKDLSLKYAESPQVIFTKLMGSAKMCEYLKGLGEMACVAERLLNVVKTIGVRFDNDDEFTYDKLMKTVTECRQLGVKYNLLEVKSQQLAKDTSTYNIYL